MCTSGTTGKSKGAVLSQAAMIWQMCTMAGATPLFQDEDKVNLMLTKSTHISGAVTPFSSLFGGIGITYLTFITRQRVLDAVQQFTVMQSIW